jgi:hypothetical protein
MFSLFSKNSKQSKSNEISSEAFKRSFNYTNLKNTKFQRSYLCSLENDEVKISYFYETVLPSLATQAIVPKQNDLFKRFICLDEKCLLTLISFSTKQSYIRHVIEKHGNKLPVNGDFLSNQTTVGYKVFDCARCKLSFNRKDHLDQHLRSSLHIKNMKINVPQTSLAKTNKPENFVNLDEQSNDTTLSALTRILSVDDFKRKLELSANDDEKSKKKMKHEPVDINETKMNCDNINDEDEEFNYYKSKN